MESVKTKFYSPLRYPGGKSCIFPFMSKFFYENDMIGVSYAEPYAGGAGLALRLLFEEYVDHIFINDLDPAIYTFWKVILERPIEFCDWINNVEISVKNWRKYKAIQNEYINADEMELAKSTFFLNRTNISGVIKGGLIGGINQNGRFKMDARFNKQDLIDKIFLITKFADRISLSNYDGISFIQQLNKKKEDVFIYLDPPYYQKGSDLYMNFLTANDHRKLRDNIKKLDNQWMISYDNDDFILDLYSGYRKVVYQLSQCASNRVGDEVLIFKNDQKFETSIHTLKDPRVY